MAKSHPSKADIKALVNMLQEAYGSRDVILSALGTDELLWVVDNICRAFSVSLDKSDDRYVFNKLLVASSGLALDDRKRKFMEKKLLIQGEFQWSSFGHAKFVFSSVGSQPILLVSHVFGAGLLNQVEAVLGYVQEEYLWNLGFDFDRDPMDIWLRDAGGCHYKVQSKNVLTDPRWEEASELAFDRLETHLESRALEEEDVVFFKGGEEYTAYKHVRRILGAARRRVFLVDPYVNDSTITMLECVPADVVVNVLYKKLQGDAPVLAEKFVRERGKSDFRRNGTLHDRYLLTGGRVFILGASLNKFGSKATTIVSIRDKEVAGRIEQHFEEVWNQSEKLAT